MADKDFKVKNKLYVNGLSNASGVILATNNNLDSSTTLPTQYGGTGTTTSPNAGQIPYSSSGTNYAPTDLSSLTISNSGGSTITADSASTKGLIIKGAASQTANLQEWQSSAGTVLSFIRSDGLIRADAKIQTPTIYGSSTTSGTQVNIATAWTFLTNVSTNVGIIIKGSASQTANLQEWQNSAGSVLSSITSNGYLAVGGATTGSFTSLATVRAGGSSQVGVAIGTEAGTSSDALRIFNATGGTILTTIKNTGEITAPLATFTANATSVIPLTVKAIASQTADLQQWQNSAGTVLAAVSSIGTIRSSIFANLTGGLTYIATNFDTSGIGIVTSSAAQKGLIIRGSASQTANLQEWQDNAGNIKALVGSGGNAVFNGIRSGSGSTTGAINAYTTAAQIGILVQGAASQSADLQQWQNSAGTVNARIDAYGTFQNGTASGYGAWINVQPKLASDKGIIIRGADSQTASLQEWQNSAGAAIARIKANGNTVLIGALTVNQSNTAEVGDNYGIGSFEVKGTSFMIPRAATGIGLIIRGLNSQSANLQEWQNNAGTVLASIASTGQINAGAGFYTDWAGVGTGRIGAAHLSVSSQYLGNIVSIFKGISGQTANLTEWQNSSGTVLTKVDSSGIVTATNGFITSASYKLANGIISLGYTNTYTATIGVVAGTPTNETTLIVKKKDSTETGNLQEWQNSSGTVLASINASGDLSVQNLTVNGTTTTINSTTLTVDDKNIELASVASPTDTTADGAGITIKGATDKTFNWVQSTGAFTSSEPISTPALSVSGNSVSSNITLAAGKRYFVDTTSARTLTLPASPSLGDEIKIFDASGTAATNNITVARNGNKINGQTEDAIIDVNQASSVFVYTGATVGWRFD